jgi:hypothetical protein
MFASQMDGIQQENQTDDWSATKPCNVDQHSTAKGDTDREFLRERINSTSTSKLLGIDENGPNNGLELIANAWQK